MLRAKFPNVVDGGIAASVPIRLYSGIIEDAIPKEGFWRAVTSTASRNKGCVHTTRNAFNELIQRSRNKEDNSEILDLLRFCPATKKRVLEDNTENIWARIALFLVMAWDTVAMGNCEFYKSSALIH